MKISGLVLILIFSCVLAGCDKPNLNPELTDPIYSDLLKELSSAKSHMESSEKDLLELKKTYESAVPQTGQIKYAQKRYFEAEANLAKLKQMYHYYELRVQSRRDWDQEHYLEAYKQKKSWPDPAEFEEYKSQKSLEQASLKWDAKARIEESKAELNKANKPQHPQE